MSSSAARRTACYPTWHQPALIVHRAHPSQQLRVRSQRETASHISGDAVESTKTGLEPSGACTARGSRRVTAGRPFGADKQNSEWTHGADRFPPPHPFPSPFFFTPFFSPLTHVIIRTPICNNNKLSTDATTINGAITCINRRRTEIGVSSTPPETFYGPEGPAPAEFF